MHFKFILCENKGAYYSHCFSVLLRMCHWKCLKGAERSGIEGFKLGIDYAVM